MFPRTQGCFERFPRLPAKKKRHRPAVGFGQWVVKTHQYNNSPGASWKGTRVNWLHLCKLTGGYFHYHCRRCIFRNFVSSISGKMPSREKENPLERLVSANAEANAFQGRRVLRRTSVCSWYAAGDFLATVFGITPEGLRKTIAINGIFTLPTGAGLCPSTVVISLAMSVQRQNDFSIGLVV